MINELINFFENKKIVILGFGREGISSYNLIRKHLPEQKISIADAKNHFEDKFDFLLGDKNVDFISGNSYLDGLEKFDIILKSPGISFVNIDTSKYIDKVTSQVELLLEYFNVKTIGITGTKGKSTTSSLIYKILDDQNTNCKFMGNIGLPVFDYVDELEEGMTVVLELSSHQLEFVKKSPNISILLNVFEEHLDHYESYEKYAEAKCNIYKFQTQNDYFLYNVDNDMLKKCVGDTVANTLKVSLHDENCDVYLKDEWVYFKDEPIYNKNSERNLLGQYNLNNIMFALGVAKILNLDIKKAEKSIAEFKTLEHRLELVGKFDGVYYYDNCIGTIPMATIEAVKALNNVDTLIIGGMDRGIDYSEFIEFLDNCNIRNIVCMPKTGHDIAKKLKNKNAIIVDTLEEAVDVSKKVTEKEKSCLISPAAASYGFFKNFEEKGNKFKELVRAIK